MLMVSLLLGPRIPIAQLSANQNVTLRFDDLIILIMLVAGIFIYLSRKRQMAYPNYMFYLVSFVISSLISSIVISYVNGYSMVSSFLFWSRDIEYLSLAFLVPVYLNDESDYIVMFKIIFWTMLLNIGWLLYQIFSGTHGQLIKFVDVSLYAYALIGESQVALVAFVYSISIILFLAVYLFYKKKPIFIFFIVASLAGLIGTLSRATLLSTAITVSVLIILNIISKKEKIGIKIISVTIVTLVVIVTGLITYQILESSGFMVRRLQADVAMSALEKVRSENVWKPLLRHFIESPILGFGKGNIREIHISFDEAHNYYLRVLLETGFVGFVLFMLFLFFVIKTILRMLISSLRKDENDLFVIICAMGLLNILILALANDVLNSSLIAIIFYSIVGSVNFRYQKNLTAKERLAP
jgi:hypothetical protein